MTTDAIDPDVNLARLKKAESNRRAYLKDQERRKLAAKEYRQKNADAVREADRARYQRRREYAMAYQRDRHARDAEEIKARKRAHYAANRDRMLEVARQRRQDNPEFFLSMNLKRKARQRCAVPPWFGELDALVWIEASDLARRRMEVTGVPWAADHMIPLAGKEASGLHVWNNCQVIPACINNSKKNKLILTDPLEWLKFI